jgi:hypothetical protein
MSGVFHTRSRTIIASSACPTSELPPAVRAADTVGELCAALGVPAVEPVDEAMLRERFARLGDAWERARGRRGQAAARRSPS